MRFDSDGTGSGHRLGRPSKVAVADKVVSKMQERGELREEDEAPAPAPAGKGSTAAEPNDSADVGRGDDSQEEAESV